MNAINDPNGNFRKRVGTFDDTNLPPYEEVAQAVENLFFARNADGEFSL